MRSKLARTSVLLGVLGSLSTAGPARPSGAREICERQPLSRVSFSGSVQGSFEVEEPPVLATWMGEPHNEACGVRLVLQSPGFATGEGFRDTVSLIGFLPRPLAKGAYPIGEALRRPGASAGVGMQAIPDCGRPGTDCESGLQLQWLYEGSLTLDSVTAQWIRGQFQGQHRRTGLEVSGSFSARPGDILGRRLPQDHACVSTCPTKPEVPTPDPNETPGHRDPVLTMTPDDFERNGEAQDRLFRLATGVRERQESFGQHLLDQAPAGGTVESILKRDAKEAFVAGVVAKAHRNDYRTIGEMDDMVRGRFNLCRGEDVDKLAEILLYTLPAPGDLDDEGNPIPGPFVRLGKSEPTRRPVKSPECPCEEPGYPRYHVIVQDQESGITHEWQIGTAAVSDVYEISGIPFPPEMWLDFESGALAPDLHDVDYDLFRVGVKGHDKKNGLNNYEDLGLAAFGRRLDALSAAAHCLGYDLRDLDDRIAELHAEAADLLQRVVDHYGIEQVRSWYH